jgi:[ribosomal protein S5]-alanine N-acetyltransferase
MNGSGAGSGQPILTTARMSIRPFTRDDLGLIAELHRDPEVGRYMGGIWSDDEMAAALDRFVTEHATRGHSKWAVFTTGGAFVGRAGISRWPATGELELGYAFRPEYWGQGLATEAARAIADWTFANTGVDHIIAFTHPQNYGSQRVLERIGMVRIAPDRDMGFEEPSAYFEMRKP